MCEIKTFDSGRVLERTGEHDDKKSKKICKKSELRESETVGEEKGNG